MMLRTDLALEASESLLNTKDKKGFSNRTETIGDLTISETIIKTEEIAREIGKPIGKYITVDLPHFTDNAQNTEHKAQVISTKIKPLLPKSGLIFVVGLGNSSITPDAFGPETVKSILATRHITGEIARSAGLNNLRPVAVLSPGVLGQTGIEVSEIICSIAKKINPTAIIVIDALVSKETKRLGSTIQIANTGICPGSGVGNCRPLINKDIIGIPVISIGVPTIVDAITLAEDLVPEIGKHIPDHIKGKVFPRGEPMMVTPREIDLLISRAAKLVAISINCTLHPDFEPGDIMALI